MTTARLTKAVLLRDSLYSQSYVTLVTKPKLACEFGFCFCSHLHYCIIEKQTRLIGCVLWRHLVSACEVKAHLI